MINRIFKNPARMLTLQTGEVKYLYHHTNKITYEIYRLGGMIRIAKWIPDINSVVDSQLRASIKRQFFLNLELERQALVRRIALLV